MAKEQPDPADAEAANARMAMKLIRQEVKRVIDRWDPLCLKGLPGFANEYNEIVGPLAVMVRKRFERDDISGHLERLMDSTWRLPPDRPKCKEIAEKLWRIGSFLDGA